MMEVKMMMKKQKTSQAAPDLEEQIAAARTARDEAAAVLVKRCGQLEATEATATEAAERAKSIAEAKRPLLVEARVDLDADARAKLDALREQEREAERERQEAEDTLVEFKERLAAAEHEARHTVHELARVENRAGAARNADRMAELRTVFAERLAPLLIGILDEIGVSIKRSEAAKLPTAEINDFLDPQRALAIELWEAIWAIGATHKEFTRAWGRPPRWERARIETTDDGINDTNTGDADRAA